MRLLLQHIREAVWLLLRASTMVYLVVLASEYRHWLSVLLVLLLWLRLVARLLHSLRRYQMLLSALCAVT